MRDIVTIGVLAGGVTIGSTDYAETPIGVAAGAYQSSLTVASARLLAKCLTELADLAELRAKVYAHNTHEGRPREKW